MVIFETTLVDTDILIKAYRGDKIKQRNLKFLKDKYCISVITACELLNGAKNIHQSGEFNKALRYYPLAFIDEVISDALIAATAIRNSLFLYTDNIKDFNFIEGIKFYKEK